MKIDDILRRKGGAVATVSAGTSVREVLAELARHDIGALLVLDGEALVGIVSERDLVRALHDDGPALLERTAGDLMSRSLTTTEGSDSVDSAMRTMTDRRVRHLPVVENGALVGLVSIGDVVKSRIDELEAATDQLEHYIAGG